MGSPEQGGVRGRSRASSARPDGARHRGARASLPQRLVAFGRSGAGALAVAGAVLVLGLVGAVFSSTTQNPPNVYTAAQLDAYVPTAVTATRTSSTTCLVSWTPASNPPAGMTYDVTNGSGTTVVTGAAGTSATVTVPVTAVTPTVKVRSGSWVSTAATAASPACLGWPDAPGSLTLTPSDSAVSATWTAPAANGGTLASYTAVISPAPSSGSASCIATVPTTSCSWSNLSNGLTYTVSVTATSNVGTGPAATATAIPYPSSVMTSSALKLWLDGADSATILASSGCTGATATTTVGCWKDKSASANDAVQATGANQPSLSTVSARSVPTFNGTSSVLSLTPASLPTGTSPSSTFIALRTTEASPASSDWRTALTWGSGASSQTRSYQKNSFGTAMGATSWGGSLSSGGSITANVTGILSDTWTSTAYTGFWNGTAGSAVSTATSTGTAGALVGAQLGSTSYWAGPIPEIIVVQGALTTNQRRSVEEYLSRKWSVTIPLGPPTAVAAAAGDAQATVSWTAPYDGGSPITSSTVTAVPSDGTLATVTLSCASSPCTLTGLTNGVTYTVTVTANNGTGAGAASSSVTVVPRPALLASTNAALWLDGVDVDGDGVLEGTAESCDTATPCTASSNVLKRWVDKTGGGRDAVQSTTSMAGTWNPSTGRVSFSGNGYYQTATGVPTGPGVTAFAVVSSATSTFNTNGWFVGSRAANGWMLHPGISGPYAKFFGVTSTGFNLQTSPSPDMAPATAITNPHVWDGQISGGTSAQTMDLAVDGVASATTSGTAPRAAANIVLTIGADDLDLTNRRGRGAFREILVFKTALTATERRTVRAYLARKWGAPVVPDAPTSVTATPSTTANQTATVAWTAPAWNGGAAVTYTVTGTSSDATAAPVSQSCASSPCTVTGFTDGAAYTVTVAAVNQAGSSAAATATTTNGTRLTTYPAAVMTAAATQLWLDGADPTTLLSSTACTGSTATSGTTIGCWKDKSSQANSASQTTFARRPVVSSINGLTTPAFDGTDDYYPLDAAKLPTGTTPSGIFVVAAQEDTGSSDVRHVIGWGAAATGQGRAVEKGAFTSKVYVDTYGTWSPVTTTKNWPTGTAAVADGVVTSTTFTSNLDGAVNYTATAANSTGTSAGAAVGATGWNTGTGVWKGRIAEVVVTSTSPTAAETRTIQEYLGRKWGVALAPGAVTGVSATVSSTTDGATDVSWTAPSGWNGGSAISAYTVTMTPSDGSLATVTASCASSPCTVTGLTNGGVYTVTVAAVNTTGTGVPASAATSLVQYPATVMTTAVTKAWFDAAASTALYTDTGCSTPVTGTGQSVACWTDRSGQANDLTQGTATQRPTSGTVAGRSVPVFDGSNDWLSKSTTTLPTGTTSTVTFVAAQYAASSPASGGDQQLVLSGTTTTAQARYVYKPSSSNEVAVNANFTTNAADAPIAASTPFVVAADHTGGTGYGVRLSSRPRVSGSASYNVTGTELQLSYSTLPWNGAIMETVIVSGALTDTQTRTVEEYLARKWGAAITPSAPSGVTVTGADSQATVSWTTPWNGGSAITGSTVTATPTDGSLATISQPCTSPCTVTGMTNGATYSFVVTATNAVGTGPGSTAVSASAYPATLFTAADLKVWLDAQYDGGLSTASDCSGSGATSGVVGCWKDRSGNGWNAPAASGATGATLTAAAVNGRTALRFSKSTATMYKVTSAGVGAVGTADRSLFAVGSGRTTLSTTATGDAGVVAAFTTSYASGLLAKATGGTTTVGWLQSDAYEQSATPTGAYAGASITSGTPFLVSTVLSSSGGTLTNALALNGEGSTTDGTVAGSWLTYGDAFAVGAADPNLAASFAYPLDGDVGEVLLFDRALTAVERRTVEEYLARHWGQTIAPGAPTLTSVSGSGQLQMTWTAPTWNGGSAVTTYVATAVQGATTRTCSTSATTCTITGVSGGTWTVSITAANTAGTGPASNTLTGTP